MIQKYFFSKLMIESDIILDCFIIITWLIYTFELSKVNYTLGVDIIIFTFILSY